MDLIKIPNKFFEDFHKRYLSTSESYRKKYGIPQIIKKDKTHSWISRQDANLKELLWDADYFRYVDTYPNRALARETVRAIEDSSKLYEVHWKEGYPKCDPRTVSLQELKEDKDGLWNFSAYGEDVLDDISNLEINESLDVVGVTERTTFIRKE